MLKPPVFDTFLLSSAASFTSVAPALDLGWKKKSLQRRPRMTPIPTMRLLPLSDYDGMKTKSLRWSSQVIHRYRNLLKLMSLVFLRTKSPKNQSLISHGELSSRLSITSVSCRRYARTRRTVTLCLLLINPHNSLKRVLKYPNRNCAYTPSNSSRTKSPTVEENGDRPTCA